MLHQMKTDVATRDIPIIVLSIVDNKDLGYRLGAFDYLVKPFDREAMLATLARIVLPLAVARFLPLRISGSRILLWCILS